MATLNANALVQLDRTKGELDIVLTDTEFDDQVIQYINVASDNLELLCNRIFHQDTYIHRLTGKGDKYVLFEQFPVTTLTSVSQDDQWKFTKDLPVGTECDVDKEVFLVRRGSCNKWTSNIPMSIKATYIAGYVTIPDGLQQVCIEYVRYLYYMSSSRRSGTTNRGKLGEDVTFIEDIPAIVRFLIMPWKREAVIKRAAQLNGFMIFDDKDKPK
jgi:hypothetical protein